MIDLSAVEELYFSALQRPSPDRTAFIRQAPVEPAVREAVEKLLAVHDEVGSFLESSGPGGPFTELTAHPETGSCRLVGEIARGGMGAVLRGRDLAFGRDLAVKMQLPEHLGRPDLRARFLREARLTGRLQHPCIVPVYGLGDLPDGRLYFSMKLIQGKTLAALLRDRATPRDDLPRLLDIFARVCEAVAYAHSRGVIHRDLKPANVMVGEFGEVQVMDWGLAKVLPGPNAEALEPDHASSLDHFGTAAAPGGIALEETSTGLLLGTPGYMSPEQARGEHEVTDRRADVFGLGAVLTEILTGSPPYGAGSRSELVRRAARNELQDAYQRLAGCEADPELVTLARHCLEVWPQDRPRDAGEVARAVATYHDSVTERLRKAEVERTQAQVKAAEERKRRRLALAATVLVTGLLGGTACAYLLSERARAEEQRAMRRQEAADLLDQAAGLTDAPSGDAPLAEARGLILRAHGLAEAGAGDEALLGRAEAMRAEIEARQRDRRLQRDLEAALLAGGRLDPQAPSSTLAPDLPAYRRAFAEYGWRVGQESAAEVARRLGQRPAAVREVVAAALVFWLAVGRPADEPHLGWLAQVLEATDPQTWAARARRRSREGTPDQARAGLIRLAEEASRAGLPSFVLTLLVHELRRAESVGPAEQLLLQTLKRHPGDFWGHLNLGALQLGRDRRRAARHLAVAAALRPDAPAVWLNLAVAEENDEDSLAAARRAVELEQGLALAHLVLGATYERMKRPAEAEKAYRLALKCDSAFGQAHASLARLLAAEGQADEALKHYQEAARLAPRDGQALTDLALALLDQRKTAEAVGLFRRAIAAQPESPSAHAGLALVHWAEGDEDTALELFKKAAGRTTRLAPMCYPLGLILSGRGLHTEALLQARAAVEAASENADSHSAYAACLLAAGRFAEALRVCEKAPPGPHAETQKALARHAAECRLYLGLEKQLGAVLRDRARLSPAEVAGYARLCQLKRLHRESALLYAEAFAAAPALAGEPGLGHHRYKAARAAAQAGSGDSAGPSEGERRRWRRQALTWLSAEVEAWKERLLSGGQDEARRALQRMRADADLAGLRDPRHLADLPEEERGACRRLWSDVDALLRALPPPALGGERPRPPEKISGG